MDDVAAELDGRSQFLMQHATARPRSPQILSSCAKRSTYAVTAVSEFIGSLEMTVHTTS
jgi:hypothetical protein